MPIVVPGVLIAAGASLYLFHRFNRIRDNKLDARKENLNDTRQQYLRSLIEAKRKADQAAEEAHAAQSSSQIQPTHEPHVTQTPQPPQTTQDTPPSPTSPEYPAPPDQP